MARSLKLNMKREVILERLRAKLTTLTPKPIDDKDELKAYRAKVQEFVKSKRAEQELMFKQSMECLAQTDKILKDKSFLCADDLHRALTVIPGNAMHIPRAPSWGRYNTKTADDRAREVIVWYIKTFEACADETIALTMEDDIFRYLND